MFPASFDYHRASSVDEALGLLGSTEGAKLLAGGHSLLPMMKLRLAQPAALIDIGRIAELKGITRSGGGVRIGALTTHAELVSSAVLKEDCPLVVQAASRIADPQVRNKGTIGGNIAHGDPASDLPGVLVALGAVIHLRSAGGARQIPAASFFVDLLTTDLGEGEILTAIDVPKLAAGTGTAYESIEQPASGYSLCAAAAVVTLGADGTCQSASLCFNGLQATPLRASVVEVAVSGKRLDAATLDAALGGLTVADPLSDMHASGEYRVHLAKVLGRRALLAAADRARA